MRSHSAGVQIPSYPQSVDTLYRFKMARKKKGSKKEREARKILLEQPWWKFKDNWFIVGIFVVLVLVVGLIAVG